MGTADATDVLVIEDHAGAARGLRALLLSRGYRVDLAMDAAEALRRVADRSYGLVVADCDLGEQDGSKLVARIRKLCPSLSVLVVSARDRKSLLDLFPGLDLRDCLEKPVDPVALLAAVERHLRPVGGRARPSV
jgi:DNA-binding response OmpR family regulator